MSPGSALDARCDPDLLVGQSRMAIFCNALTATNDIS
jgi:hypothetical protein